MCLFECNRQKQSMLLLLVAFSLTLIRYEDEYDDDGGDWYSNARPPKKTPQPKRESEATRSTRSRSSSRHRSSRDKTRAARSSEI